MTRVIQASPEIKLDFRSLPPHKRVSPVVVDAGPPSPSRSRGGPPIGAASTLISALVGPSASLELSPLCQCCYGQDPPFTGMS